MIIDTHELNLLRVLEQACLRANTNKIQMTLAMQDALRDLAAYRESPIQERSR